MISSCTLCHLDTFDSSKQQQQQLQQQQQQQQQQQRHLFAFCVTILSSILRVV